MITIAFAGWWTGWHIFPIKSLIENIDRKKYKILWFWRKNSLEEKISKELKDFWYNVIFISICAWKIRRQKDIKSIFKNIIDVFKNLIGFFQSLFYIVKYKPVFIFSKWWFVAFNPSLAWKICWKKVYLHESDTIPWLVNKIVWKFADKVFVWFQETKRFFNSENTEFVWQILSNEIKKFSVKIVWKTNLIVVWWSQWAKILIQIVKNLLDKWKLYNFNIFIIGWLLNSKNMFKNYPNVEFFEFIWQNKLFELYSIADISLTRWSATSLAEQEYFNIKKIIVPLPYTGWNHQYYNWLVYKNRWDYLLDQNDENFENKFFFLLNDLDWFKKENKTNLSVLLWTNKVLKIILE